MTRYLVTLKTAADRAEAARIITQAPLGTRVEFKAAKRSTDQNSKLWACLSDISRQLDWHGQRLRPDDWKTLFMDALKRELRTMPSLYGNGMVELGRSSSDLSKREFSDLIELIHAFGALHGVQFGDEEAANAA